MHFLKLKDLQTTGLGLYFQKKCETGFDHFCSCCSHYVEVVECEKVNLQ